MEVNEAPAAAPIEQGAQGGAGVAAALGFGLLCFLAKTGVSLSLCLEGTLAGTFSPAASW